MTLLYFEFETDDFGVEDLRICCEVEYTPGRAEVRYLKNGDPGYPAEPAEWDVISAEYYKGDVLIDATENSKWGKIEDSESFSERVYKAASVAAEDDRY